MAELNAAEDDLCQQQADENEVCDELGEIQEHLSYAVENMDKIKSDSNNLYQGDVCNGKENCRNSDNENHQDDDVSLQNNNSNLFINNGQTLEFCEESSRMSDFCEKEFKDDAVEENLNEILQSVDEILDLNSKVASHNVDSARDIDSDLEIQLSSKTDREDLDDETDSQIKELSHDNQREESLGIRKRVLQDKNTNKVIDSLGDEKTDATKSSIKETSPDVLLKQIRIKEIVNKLSASENEREALKQLAISRNGLVSDNLRAKAWPHLLAVDIKNIPEKPSQETLHSHCDYQQVVLDVNRSLKRFPPGMAEEIRMSMQDQLVDCIMRVLVDNSDLHYYQGFHDIVVTFLLVVGEDITFALMQRLSEKHLRDFMFENMEKTSGMLHYLYPIVGKSCKTLRKFMENAEVGTMFCLPWLITWYGHVLSDIKHIVRLYDFFIACHPLMPIYLAAAIVLYREQDIMKCEAEMPYIHCLLSNIPDDLPFEQLIIDAVDLFTHFPPSHLEREAKDEYDKQQREQERKRQELEELKRRKALRMQKQQYSYWSFRRFMPNNNSLLVKMSMFTGAALLSAAAVSFINNHYISPHYGDSWMDMHWLWASK